MTLIYSASVSLDGYVEDAFAAGLVDECHVFVCPIIVGGGKHALPQELRAQLELVDERRFGNGVVDLRYAVGSDRAS